MRPISPRLIAPPTDEIAVYPYARVWRSVILLGGVLLGSALIINVLDTFVLQLDRALYLAIDIAIALLPALLWLIFCLLPERSVEQPRRGLATAFLGAALVANGVTLPLVEGIFQLETWLSFADPVTRVIGFTLTLGIAQQLSQYLVVRFVAWDSLLRVRTDVIAYGLAAAVGYATAVSIVTALQQPAAPGAFAYGVFTVVSFTVAPALLVAYGMGEVRLSNPNAFLLPITFALAALIYGVMNTLRGALVNATFTLEGQAQVSAPSPSFGLLVAVALWAGIVLLVTTLIATAERREAEMGEG